MYFLISVMVTASIALLSSLIRYQNKFLGPSYFSVIVKVLVISLNRKVY